MSHALHKDLDTTFASQDARCHIHRQSLVVGENRYTSKVSCIIVINIKNRFQFSPVPFLRKPLEGLQVQSPETSMRKRSASVLRYCAGCIFRLIVILLCRHSAGAEEQAGGEHSEPGV